MNNEFWALLQGIRSLSSDAYEVTFSFVEDVFSFSPGQYVWVVLENLAFPDQKGERRAFSVSSSSSDRTSISIQFRDTGSGYKRSLLSLPVGSRVKILGPYGSSYVPQADQRSIVFIAGGVGITPFLSLFRSIKNVPPNQKYTVITINSSAQSAIAEEELSSLTSHLQIEYVRLYGRMSQSTLPSTLEYQSDHFFICGPPGMVDDVHAVLQQHSVPQEHMHFEQHYPTVQGMVTESDFILKPGEKNIMLQAVQDSRHHVIITDANGQIVFANKKAQENTGFSLDEMRGNTPRLWGGIMPKEFYAHFWTKKQEGKGFDGELTNRRKNGDIYYVLAHISPIIGNNNSIIGYIGTEEDITKEKQIDKSKTEFISLASHQLRTPLSTINWYCEMLLSGDAGVLTSEQIQFVEQAYAGSLRMSKLVSALLNVSRIETGTYMVNPEPVDIVQMVRSVLDESKPMLDEKFLTVSLEKDEIPVILLDPSLTTIILQNLITNSVKYTTQGGSIFISLRLVPSGSTQNNEIISADSLLIEVRDTGIGIPREQQNQVFQKLFRADNARKSNTDGTGLGLYLVKSLLEHSLGKIWFTSQEGRGASFFVLLPLSGMVQKQGDKQLEQIREDVHSGK